ncbi:hypothetical protein [Streptacidiphilus sp. EB103A]|uniref:hypothetical protein n=1 Tax=Streptacidiphilus sp. EB103A TaxID=3156275 RepID=UPI003517DC60
MNTDELLERIKGAQAKADERAATVDEQIDDLPEGSNPGARVGLGIARDMYRVVSEILSEIVKD